MIRKLLSILLSVMLVATIVPTIAFSASATEYIAQSDIGHTRGGGYADVNQGISANYAYLRSDATDNKRHTFVKFDFTDYLSKIEAADSLSFYIGTRDIKDYDFNVVVLPYADNSWTQSTITHNKATELGLFGSGITVNGFTKNSGGDGYTFSGMLSAVKQALAANPESTTLTFRLDSLLESTEVISLAASTAKLTLSYDSDNVSDETYVQNKAASLEWSHISEQPQNEVTSDLAFPSKLYGADVTWSSNSNLITSDGKVTFADGIAQTVTLTATLTYNGLTATKAFEVTVPVAPTMKLTEAYSQKTHVRGGANYENSVLGMTSEDVTRDGNVNTVDDQDLFYQFDFTGQEAIVANASKATFSITKQTSGKTFTAYLLSDASDDWKRDDLTYKMAYEKGLITDKGYTIATGASALSGNTFTSNDFAQALKSAFDENPSNGLITIRVESDYGTLVFNRPVVTINLEYNEADTDPDTFFEAKKDDLEWKHVSADAIGNVTADINLPEKFYGFDVTWSSDNVAINASTGKVTQSKEAETTVNLTATISNGTKTHTKVFEVTVAKAQKTTIQIPLKEKMATRGGIYGNDVQDLAYASSYGWVYARNHELNGENDRHIYLTFDLSGIEQEAINAAEANLSFTPSAISGGSWKVEILPETNYNCTAETLTYNLASGLGMMDDATLIQSGVTVAAGQNYASTDFAQALKTVISSNPGNSVVTIRISAESDSDTGLRNITPILNLSYYNADLNDEAFFEDVKADLEWENITSQSTENVIADLKLPSELYGFDIAWASDNAAVNAQTGEVTIGAEKINVKLTATVSKGSASYSKEYDIIVGNKSYEIDFSNAKGSGAKIYADIAEDISVRVVLAAYYEGEMTSVSYAQVNLTDGENCVGTQLNVEGATQIKLMLLTDLDTITPLCTFKVK